MNDYTELQEDFLDGMDEIYTTLFTDQLKFYALDTTATSTNIYGEAPLDKMYKTPVYLAGKLVIYTDSERENVEENKVQAVITIPTKQLITNGIAFTSYDDLKTLERAVFEFKGRKYNVDRVSPRIMVADIFQTFVFNCTLAKKNSLED